MYWIIINKQNKYWDKLMENNLLQDVLSVLVDVKVELQRSKVKVYQDLLKKIDVCISKVAPLIDVFTAASNNTLLRDRTVSHKQISTFDKKFEIKEINYQDQKKELLKVKKSFIKEEDDLHLNSSGNTKKQVIIDYFLLKYDFKFKQYIILGRPGGEKSDRKVFLDLFTEQKSKSDLKKMQKTQSMTSIFKAIYTPDKIGQPFILPNCQQQQIKYLFIFGLEQCGCFEKQFYKTQTLYCFVARQFILGQLINLMDSLAKICFEKRISQITPTEENKLYEVLANLNTKKAFATVQESVEQFVKSYDYENRQMLSLSVSKMERWKSNTKDHYLGRSSLRWSLLKKHKSKQQKCFLTLVLLFYFSICEYKIILISQNSNKHIISELIIGLLAALEPLPFIYPIVTATITPHHMEFTNSPVPLLLGIWGNQQYHSIAKSTLKRRLKSQKQLSSEELQRQTPMVIFDLEDHSISFLQNNYKQIFQSIQKIQEHIEIRYQGVISQKLSSFMHQLLKNVAQSNDWINNLRKKVHQTQMYQFYTNRV